MSYTVTQENFNKAIELLALLNVDLRDMERKHGANVTKYTQYNAKTEKLLDEMALISLLLGVDVREIDDAVCSRALEIDKSRQD